MVKQDGPIDRRTLLKVAGVAATGLLTGKVLGTSAPASILAAAQAGIDPFEFHVDDSDLEDLSRRLSAARWPGDAPGDAWSYGTDRTYLRELIAYWRDHYEWRTHETALNAFDHYTTTVEGQPIHFIHQRGRGPSPLPLVLTHGWPGTIWEMLPSVRALVDPASHGGEAVDAFDVVVPSIPGFGFSGEPIEGTDAARTAELWIALMKQLGYQRFGAYGSDWGSLVTRHLGARFADQLVGIITPGTPPRAQRDPRTDEERAYVEATARWAVDETGYQRIQGTKPQTLAYGLTDSPVGLAAWITEKLRSWSDCNGDVESRFTKDQILTLVSIYWHTRTIGTSVRYYHANGLGDPRTRRAIGPSRVPQGFADFLGIASRSRLPQTYVDNVPDHVTLWSVHDRGGHFPAIEEPELLVQDLRTFFRPLRAA